MNDQTGYPAIDAFDFQSWYRDFYQGETPINGEMIRLVAEFALLWNAYENEAFNQSVTIRKVLAHARVSVAGRHVSDQDFESQWEYLRSNLPHQADVNFPSYLLSSQVENQAEQRGYVADVKRHLASETTDLQSKITTMSYVVCKMRDNLFHGAKELHILYDQVGLFKFAISFLSTYLNKTCRPEKKRDEIKRKAKSATKGATKSKEGKETPTANKISPRLPQETPTDPVTSEHRVWITAEQYPELSQAEIDHHNENETKPFRVSQKA